MTWLLSTDTGKVIDSNESCSWKLTIPEGLQNLSGSFKHWQVLLSPNIQPLVKRKHKKLHVMNETTSSTDMTTCARAKFWTVKLYLVTLLVAMSEAKVSSSTKTQKNEIQNWSETELAYSPRGKCSSCSIFRPYFPDSNLQDQKSIPWHWWLHHKLHHLRENY